jgi:hypothetical protein
MLPTPIQFNIIVNIIAQIFFFAIKQGNQFWKFFREGGEKGGLLLSFFYR